MLYNHLVALYPGTFEQHNWNHWVMKSKEDINLKRLCGNVLEKSENGSGWGRCDLNILYTCVRLTKKLKSKTTPTFLFNILIRNILVFLLLFLLRNSLFKNCYPEDKKDTTVIFLAVLLYVHHTIS